MQTQCGFCASIGDLSPFGTIIYQDEQCAVLLHPDSSVAGHAMLIWKRHVENIADLDDAERLHFVTTHARAERALLSETGRERAILLKLGIQVPHLHLHIYPMAAGASRDDVMAAFNGVHEEPREGDFVERLRRSLTAPAT